MHHHPVGAFGKGTLAAIKAMPPLATHKNEYVAFAAGLFGAIGNGLYLRSWRDVGVSLALNIGLTIVLPGVGILPSLLFSATYGFLRVRSSNAKLTALAAEQQLIMVDDAGPVIHSEVSLLKAAA